MLQLRDMQNTFVILLAALCAISAKKTLWNELDHYTFEKYIEEFGKSYSPAEHAIRSQLFMDKLRSIRQHNQDPKQSWKKGINHMTDWSPSEFKKLLGYKKSMGFASRFETEVHVVEKISIKDLPKHIDWRDNNIISNVKDQGMCGSCWTFATTSTIESFYAKATGVLMDLSEQQILDCTPNPRNCGGTGGCGGGTAELAMAQIIQTGGLTSEWMYPYTSYFGENFSCHYNKSSTKPIARLAGYKKIPSNQYAPLMNAVATHGPIAISVDASAWGDYESGVFDGCNQTNPDIDHAVQLVGYGTDSDWGGYWLVRNSWSPLWGDKGYIKLQRTENLRCGTDISPSDGTGCKGGPSQVTVCGTCGILYDNTYPILLH